MEELGSLFKQVFPLVFGCCFLFSKCITDNIIQCGLFDNSQHSLLRWSCLLDVNMTAIMHRYIT